jgi:hypothetical protein
MMIRNKQKSRLQQEDNGISPQASSSNIPPINENMQSKRMLNISENSNGGFTGANSGSNS